MAEIFPSAGQVLDSQIPGGSQDPESQVPEPQSTEFQSPVQQDSSFPISVPQNSGFHIRVLQGSEFPISVLQGSGFQIPEPQASGSQNSDSETSDSQDSDFQSTGSLDLFLKRPDLPHMECSICLDEITNRVHPNVCSHSFCYHCLCAWSKIQLNCPLCKRSFTSIVHVSNIPNYDVQNEERRYRMAKIQRFQDMMIRLIQGNATVDDHKMFHGTHQFYIIPRGSPQINPVEAQALRVRVYHENIWSLPMPNFDNGIFSPTHPKIYKNNLSLTSRIKEFVTREVNAIRSIQRSYSNNVVYVEEEAINFIMRAILKVNIGGLKLLLSIQRFFGEFSSHFCHELYNYASCSTNTIMQYDLNVVYTVQSTFMVTSENEQRNTTIEVVPNGETPNAEQLSEPDFIIISSSRENSDVDEVINLTTSPETVVRQPVLPMPRINASNTPVREEGIEVVGFTVSIDEPSTSSGIRGQLDTSNIHSVQLTSSDEEPTSTRPVTKTVNNNRRRRLTGMDKRAKFRTIGNRMSTRNRPQPPTSSDDSD